MFWIFVLAIAAAATFMALGMYSVWFKVLSIALIIAMIIIVAMVGVILWRRVFGRQ